MNEERNLPTHIAIIMDGNRRWAKKNNLKTIQGHKKGAETLEALVRYCNSIGIKYLTVYAFSTENWKRSKEEVEGLMFLLQTYLDYYAKRIDKENIKLNVLGSRENISDSLLKKIDNMVEKTKNNKGLTFNVAFNYGGRNEITNAIKKISEKVKDGEINIEDINEDLISDNLYTSGIPDPDLMVRPSGELRIINFLSWQLVYSEFYFTDKLWPDFSTEDLEIAIDAYNKRKRNFGGTK